MREKRSIIEEYPKVYNSKTGVICNKLQQFIDERLEAAYKPLYWRQSSPINTIDINIVGQDIFKYLVDLEYTEGYNKDVQNLSRGLTFSKYRKIHRHKIIYKWLYWVSTRIFLPHCMIYDSVETLQVRIRIAVSLLNKMPYVDDDLKERLFDTLVHVFYYRLLVYDEYLRKEILNLPF